MEIKSNIEYKAMLKEIAFKEDQRDQRETRMLELLDLVEAQKGLSPRSRRQIKERQDVLARASRRKWRPRWRSLEQRLAGLEEQRKKLRKRCRRRS